MSMRIALSALLIAVVIIPVTVPTAQAASFDCTSGSTCPDLKAIPAQDVRLERVGKRLRLRFSTVSANIGDGALELRGGEIVNGKSKQRVYQRIYRGALPTGDYDEVLVGEFVYHPQHRHFHLEDYARYELIPQNGDTSLRRTSVKTSFCIQDTLPMNQVPGESWPTSPARRYIDCNGTLQGMSVGWADRYGYQLAGQEIDVTGLPAGCYDLRVTVNPLGRLIERDSLNGAIGANNTSTVPVRLTGSGVTVGC